MELNAKQLSQPEALSMWVQLAHYVPANGYPLTIDSARFDDGLGTWAHGVVGGEPEIDLDFETKKGGPWGVWTIDKCHNLWVAAHPDSPIDRLLYFISRRNCCYLNVHSSWHRMVAAAAQASFTQIGAVHGYGIWTRHSDDYHFTH